jgi:hypothetical protein
MADYGILVSTGTGFNWLPVMLMGVVFVVVLLIVRIWITYNNLINLHHRVEQGWSQVEVQLKRRNDLIPNLVQVINGYRQYEKETQTVLAEL